MDKEQMEIFNNWFQKKAMEGYGTFRNDRTFKGDDVYEVAPCDMEEFTRFLTDEFTDIVGIPCVIGTAGILFHRADLENAEWL